jgi:hypothetical protein
MTSTTYRNLSVDDVLAFEHIEFGFGEPLVFSSDRRLIAFTFQRGRMKAPRLGSSFLVGNERAQIKIVDVVTGSVCSHYPDNEFFGIFNPVFSPDDRRLAVAVTDGFSVYVGVIDLDIGGISIHCERNIDLQFMLTRSVMWVGPTMLVAALLPEGKRSLGKFNEILSREKAVLSWGLVANGSCATSSILDSRELYADSNLVDLAFIDIVTMNVKISHSAVFPESVRFSQKLGLLAAALADQPGLLPVSWTGS